MVIVVSLNYKDSINISEIERKFQVFFYKLNVHWKLIDSEEVNKLNDANYPIEGYRILI